MLATERRPPPAQLRGSAGFLLAARRVEEADQVDDRALGQQRRGVVLVDVLLDPVVVVADAAQLLDVHAPDRLEAHAHARRVQVRLEGDDLGVLLQRGVGVDLLVGGVRLDVEVVAVAEQRRRPLVERLIALGEEREAELQVRVGVVAVGVDVRGVEIQHRVGGQQASGACRGTRRGCGRSRGSASWCRRACPAPSSHTSCGGRHSGRRPSWSPWSRGMSFTSRTSTDFTQRSSVRPVGDRADRSPLVGRHRRHEDLRAGDHRGRACRAASRPRPSARPWPAAGRRRCRAARRCPPTARSCRSRPGSATMSPL